MSVIEVMYAVYRQLLVYGTASMTLFEVYPLHSKSPIFWLPGNMFDEIMGGEENVVFRLVKWTRQILQSVDG